MVISFVCLVPVRFFLISKVFFLLMSRGNDKRQRVVKEIGEVYTQAVDKTFRQISLQNTWKMKSTCITHMPANFSSRKLYLVQ